METGVVFTSWSWRVNTADPSAVSVKVTLILPAPPEEVEVQVPEYWPGACANMAEMKQKSDVRTIRFKMKVSR